MKFALCGETFLRSLEDDVVEGEKFFDRVLYVMLRSASKELERQIVIHELGNDKERVVREREKVQQRPSPSSAQRSTSEKGKQDELEKIWATLQQRDKLALFLQSPHRISLRIAEWIVCNVRRAVLFSVSSHISLKFLSCLKL